MANIVLPDANTALTNAAGRTNPAWYRILQQWLTLFNSTTAQSGVLSTTPTTVSKLPAATKGNRSFVTDATQTMTAGIGAVVVGGGTNNVPVYADGAAWRIG